MEAKRSDFFMGGVGSKEETPCSNRPAADEEPTPLYPSSTSPLPPFNHLLPLPLTPPSVPLTSIRTPSLSRRAPSLRCSFDDSLCPQDVRPPIHVSSEDFGILTRGGTLLDSLGQLHVDAFEDVMTEQASWRLEEGLPRLRCSGACACR